MNTIALIAAYGGLLLLVNEFFRRSKWANLFWFLGPLALLPVWRHPPREVPCFPGLTRYQG